MFRQRAVNALGLGALPLASRSRGSRVVLARAARVLASVLAPFSREYGREREFARARCRRVARIVLLSARARAVLGENAHE